MSDLLPETPPSPENGYAVDSTMEMSATLFNLVFGSIHDRLAAREVLEADFEALIADGTSAALTMIQENIAPQIVDLQQAVQDAQDAVEDLLATGTAPNAAKLGNQLPAYYLAPANFTVSADIKEFLASGDFETALTAMGVTAALEGLAGAVGEALEEKADTSQLADLLPLAGGTMAGDLDLDGNQIINWSGLRGHIHGLTLSNNAADATNDIDVAIGQCASDEANPSLMALGAPITKRLDAAWSVGSGNGGLDTGTVTDDTYHVWLIQRSDTGVVDALFSLSATAPTMPESYDRKAYLWPIMRSGGSIVQFVQIGNAFWKVTPTIDRSSTAAMAPGLLSLSVPTGVRVRPILQSSIDAPAASSVGNGIGSGDAGTTTATAQTAYETVITDVVDQFVTDTSARIYWSTIIYAGSITSNTLATCGWHFDREAQL